MFAQRLAQRSVVDRAIRLWVAISTLLTLALAVNVPRAYACYTWGVGQRVGLRGGAEIRHGSGLGYSVHTIVPNDNWQVDIIDGPRHADGLEWWDISRERLDGGGTGWIYIEQAGYDVCGEDPPPPPPSPGRLVLIHDLSLSRSDATVGEEVSASYRVRNIGGQAITLDYLGVQGRLNGDLNGTRGDFHWIENLALEPGEEYGYSSNRSFDIAGRWRLRPNYKPRGGDWSDVHHENRTINEEWISVRDVPAPGRLVLIQDLSLSRADATVGEEISASYRVRNIGGQAITLDHLGVQGRLNGDLNGTHGDFHWIENLTLRPGEEYGYSSDRSFDVAGSWRLRPNYRPRGGDWSDVHRENDTISEAWIDVRTSPPADELEVVGGLRLWSDGSGDWPPRVGDRLMGRYSLRNAGTLAVRLETLGIRVLMNGSEEWSVWSEVGVDLHPGGTTRFESGSEHPLQAGHYLAQAAWRTSGNEQRLGRAYEFDVGASPIPPNPPETRVSLIQPLMLDPHDPAIGERVAGSFTIRNDEAVSLGFARIGIGGRGPLGTDVHDFPWIWNVTLSPGSQFSFSAERSFAVPGVHTFFPVYQSPDGLWHEILSADGSQCRTSIAVRGGDRPPTGWTMVVEHIGDSNQILDVNRGTVTQAADGTFTLSGFSMENRSILCRQFRMRIDGEDVPLHTWDWGIIMPGQRAMVDHWARIPQGSRIEIETNKNGDTVGSTFIVGLANLAASALASASGQLYRKSESTTTEMLHVVVDQLHDVAEEMGIPAGEVAGITADLANPDRTWDAIRKIVRFNTSHPGFLPRVLNKFGWGFSQNAITLGLGRLARFWELGRMGWSGARFIWAWVFEEPAVSRTIITIQEAPLTDLRDSHYEAMSGVLTEQPLLGNWAAVQNGGAIEQATGQLAWAEQSRLIDGSRSTAWVAPVDPTGEQATTVELASGRPVTLSSVVIHPGPAEGLTEKAALGSFRVEASLDGITYRTVLTGGFSDVDLGSAGVFPISGVVARFLRLVAETAQDASSRVVVIAELEAYGTLGLRGDNYEPDGDHQLAPQMPVDAELSALHTLNTPGDQDWVRFRAAEGMPYCIHTTSLGPRLGLVLKLYDLDGSTLLASGGGGGGRNSCIGWIAPGDGVYYVVVGSLDPETWGPGTGYTLSIGEGPSATYAWQHEAEKAHFTSPVTMRQSGIASECGYLLTTAYWSGGEISFTFDVPATYAYHVWARVRGSDWNHNSFWVSVDDDSPYHYEIPPFDGEWTWGWDHVDAEGQIDQPALLTAGQHTLHFGAREAQAGLDCIVITSDPSYVPSSISPCILPDTPTPTVSVTPTVTLTPTATATETETRMPTATATLAATLAPTATVTPSLVNGQETVYIPILLRR